MIDLERIHENVNLFMVTEFGVVKRTAIEEYRNIRRSGLNAINLDDGDRLISVIVTTGNQDILIGTKLGMAIRCNEEDVRLMKRADSWRSWYQIENRRRCCRRWCS